MASIAFRRMGTWFVDEFAEIFGDLGSLFMCGFVAFIGSLSIKIMGMLAEAGEGMIAFLFQVFFGWAATGFVACAMLAAAKARLHEREPRFSDLIPTTMVLLNSIGAYMLIGLIMTMPIVLGGLPTVFAVIASIGNPQAMQSAASGAGLILIGSVIFSLLMYPLFVFAVPLIVDQRINCFTAMWKSAGMVIRDYPGLAIFSVVWIIAYGIINTICACVTLGFPILVWILGPAMWGVQMRAYRDYFGLQKDWILLESLENEGYFEMVSQMKEESAYSRSQYAGPEGAEGHPGPHGGPAAEAIPANPENQAPMTPKTVPIRPRSAQKQPGTPGAPTTPGVPPPPPQHQNPFAMPSQPEAGSPLRPATPPQKETPAGGPPSLPETSGATAPGVPPPPPAGEQPESEEASRMPPPTHPATPGSKPKPGDEAPVRKPKISEKGEAGDEEPPTGGYPFAPKKP